MNNANNKFAQAAQYQANDIQIAAYERAQAAAQAATLNFQEAQTIKQ